VPAWLAELRSVTVCSCDDYGPATKLIPTHQPGLPEQAIVVVDDDRITIAISSSRWRGTGRTSRCRHWRQRVGRAGRSHRSTVHAGRRPGRQTARAPALHPSGEGARGRHAPRRLRVSRASRFFDLEGLLDYTGAPEAAFFVDDVLDQRPLPGAEGRVPRSPDEFPVGGRCPVLHIDQPGPESTAPGPTRPATTRSCCSTSPIVGASGSRRGS
jgi:hypothetical protein